MAPPRSPRLRPPANHSGPPAEGRLRCGGQPQTGRLLQFPAGLLPAENWRYSELISRRPAAPERPTAPKSTCCTFRTGIISTPWRRLIVLCRSTGGCLPTDSHPCRRLPESTRGNPPACSRASSVARRSAATASSAPSPSCGSKPSVRRCGSPGPDRTRWKSLSRRTRSPTSSGGWRSTSRRTCLNSRRSPAVPWGMPPTTPSATRSGCPIHPSTTSISPTSPSPSTIVCSFSTTSPSRSTSWCWPTSTTARPRPRPVATRRPATVSTKRSPGCSHRALGLRRPTSARDGSHDASPRGRPGRHRPARSFWPPPRRPSNTFAPATSSRWCSVGVWRCPSPSPRSNSTARCGW